jgi:Flp pilus assembly protein TadG
MYLVRRRARRAGRGSVTAETAVVLPVVVVMLLMATWAIGLVVTHIRCLDAARDVARAVARGEQEDEARRIGERTAPVGSAVEVTRDGDDVTAVVRVSRAWPLLGGSGTLRVEERATLQAEPDQTDGDAP